MNDQSRTEMAYTVEVPQEMLDTVNSFAYMRHYDSGVDGDGMINIAVFHPEGVIDTFTDKNGVWSRKYEKGVPAEVPMRDMKLLYLAFEAQAAGANYLILESL